MRSIIGEMVRPVVIDWLQAGPPARLARAHPITIATLHSSGSADRVVRFFPIARRSRYVQSNMNRISASTWAEIRTAYAGGIGLREIARNMGIPAGTVLARSKREGWTQQIAQAKLIERPELARDLAKPDAINAITTMQSAALTMQQRAQRYAERMAGMRERFCRTLKKCSLARYSTARGTWSGSIIR